MHAGVTAFFLLLPDVVDGGDGPLPPVLVLLGGLSGVLLFSPFFLGNGLLLLPSLLLHGVGDGDVFFLDGDVVLPLGPLFPLLGLLSPFPPSHANI